MDASLGPARGKTQHDDHRERPSKTCCYVSLLSSKKRCAADSYLACTDCIFGSCIWPKHARRAVAQHFAFRDASRFDEEEVAVAMHDGPVRLLYRNLKDPAGLADLLLDDRVDIRLVRGDFLTALERDGQTFIRRQELENQVKYQNAFVTREDLLKWKTDEAYRSKVRIIGVSHVWETREHPDPRGNQLAMIAGAQLWHDRFSWYFLDYMSVYQFYRTSLHQNRSFQYTMMHMHFFYTHEFTWTYRIEDLAPFEEADRQKQVQVFFTETEVPQDGKVEVRPLADLKQNSTPYSMRGWCEAECQWSSMRSNSQQTVSLSSVSPETWTRAPMAPAMFQAKVANRELLFTHEDSAEAVKELQGRVFMEKAAECEMLEMSVLPPRELPILSASLPFYKNLTVLRISNSQVDRRGAEALSTVLTMQELNFSKLRIPMDAVRKLALGLKGNSAVLHLTLTECLVDAEGALGLADALACKETRLESLDLSHNVLGCTGAKHLSDALIHNCFLRKLDLSSNSIADDGAASMADLFENVALQMLSLDHNCFGKEAVAILQTRRNEILRRYGEIHLTMTCAGAPSIQKLEVYLEKSLLANIFIAFSCHFLFGLFEYSFLISDGRSLVGDLWLTVPSMVLLATPVLVLLLAVGTAGFKAAGCVPSERPIPVVLDCCLMIWLRMWVCVVIASLPALQVYILVRPPTDLAAPVALFVYYCPFVWTALSAVQAVVVLFHPTFRAMFWFSFIKRNSRIPEALTLYL